MGTDINFYIEKKVKDKWEEVIVPKELLPYDRSHALFDFITDEVMTPWSERGLPEDTSYSEPTEAQIENGKLWVGDHSFTYAYLDEIINTAGSSGVLENRYFFIFFARILPRLLSLHQTEDYRNIRILIGFDC